MGTPLWRAGFMVPESVSGTLDVRASTYEGGSTKRKQTLLYRPRATDADSAYLPVKGQLIARGRDLVRNVPIAAGAINLQVTSVIGSGLRLQARVDHKTLGLSDEAAGKWEARTEAEFRSWAGSVECDTQRTSTFYDLQGLAFRSTLESGDALSIQNFIERPGSVYGLKLQLVEADRVNNPGRKQDTAKLVAGVEKDEHGAPLAYYVQEQHPGNTQRKRSKDSWRRFEAFGKTTGRRNVLHLFERLRPDQTRGIPVLAPVIELVRQLGTYTDAEVDAAVNSAFFTVFVKSNNPQGLGLVDPTDQVGGLSSDEDYKVASAMMIDLGPDEEIQSPTPGRPNAAFHPFVTAVLEQIGAALEIPYELLVKHFSASFSASQAAILEAWRKFLVRREWFTRAFCRPIYEAWMDEAVARGRLDAPGYLDGDPLIRAAWLGSLWIGPPQSHIRQDIAVKASKEMIDANLSTHAREAMILSGQDFDTDIAPRLKSERAMLAQSEPGIPPAPDDTIDPDKDDQPSEDE